MIVKINYKGVTLELEGEYTPGEETVRYYPDGSGYPGSNPEFDIDSVYHNENDITEVFEAIDDWDTLENLATEKI